MYYVTTSLSSDLAMWRTRCGGGHLATGGCRSLAHRCRFECPSVLLTAVLVGRGKHHVQVSQSCRCLSTDFVADPMMGSTNLRLVLLSDVEVPTASARSGMTFRFHRTAPITFGGCRRGRRMLTGRRTFEVAMAGRRAPVEHSRFFRHHQCPMAGHGRTRPSLRHRTASRAPLLKRNRSGSKSVECTAPRRSSNPERGCSTRSTST